MEKLHDTYAPHLLPHGVVYELRMRSGAIEAPFLATYSNHCYTRSIDETDPPDLPILVSEAKRNGGTDHRVFCPDRHAFSLGLPALVGGLICKLCVQAGNSGAALYRVEPVSGQPGGWTVCLRFDVKTETQQLVLNVRSAHLRTNLPADVRGRPVPFHQLLRGFLERIQGRYPWVPELPPDPAQPRGRK
jgi:hypothetical protein